MKQKLSVAIAVMIGASYLVGCGSATSVSGTVTYEGQPIPDGWITFFPADGSGKEAGGQIAGGSYIVAEISPGEKKVEIIGVREVPFVASSEEMERQSRENPRIQGGQDLVFPADTIPPNAEGNHERVQIKNGRQTLNFDLKKPAENGSSDSM